MRPIQTMTMAAMSLMAMNAEAAGQYHDYIGQHFESWSYTDEHDTGNSENILGNANNENSYYFWVEQPSIVVIDNAGSGLSHTRMHLSLRSQFYSIEPGWQTEREGSSDVHTQRALIDRMLERYPMADELMQDMETIGDGQAFLCMELPMGEYELYCEGADIGQANNGTIRTNIRIHHLGNSPEEAIDLGTAGDFFMTENPYLAGAVPEGKNKDLYFKIRLSMPSTVSMDGMSKRRTAGDTMSDAIDLGTGGNGAATIVSSTSYDIRDRVAGMETVSDGRTIFSAVLHYQAPSIPGAVPQWAGNISGWEWEDGTESEAFAERDIEYDRNGNILSLTRTGADAAGHTSSYSYDGNRLMSVSGSGSSGGQYAYDADGNMTHDGMNGFDIEYNRLNLIKKVSRNGSTPVK